MDLIEVIVDLQFGSCGKGLLAGMLAERGQPDTVVTAWAPNAGHTYIDAKGNKFVNIALPNGIVSPKLKRILLGPGSVINPDILLAEMEHYKAHVENVDICIHEHAAVVTEAHREAERGYGFNIGSTMKGVGEAVIQKIRRPTGGIYQNVARQYFKGTPLEDNVVTVEEYNALLDEAEHVLIEGAQGFSLSINQGFYPYVTSRECTLHQILSDCGIPRVRGMVQPQLQVYGVCRTYPIRVANRYDSNGNQIGWSGPGYHDQRELKWGDIGVEPELTTVTKLPRRVFTFSIEQIRQAIRMNGVDDVFLNFANYPQDANSMPMDQMITDIGRAGAPVRWIGYGPSITDVVDVGG